MAGDEHVGFAINLSNLYRRHRGMDAKPEAGSYKPEQDERTLRGMSVAGKQSFLRYRTSKVEATGVRRQERCGGALGAGTRQIPSEPS